MALARLPGLAIILTCCVCVGDVDSQGWYGPPGAQGARPFLSPRHILPFRSPSLLCRPLSLCAASRLQVAETWDLCIENTVRKLAYGALAGGLAAMILFRMLPTKKTSASPSLGRAPCLQQTVFADAQRPLTLPPSLLPIFAGTPSARTSVLGLGAGVGVGMGYTDCKHEFDSIAKSK